MVDLVVVDLLIDFITIPSPNTIPSPTTISTTTTITTATITTATIATTMTTTATTILAWRLMMSGRFPLLVLHPRYLHRQHHR